MQNKKSIKICSNHPEYKVPLIWTFKFDYNEYWCPYCGYMCGMFGAGKNVPSNKQLVERLEIYKKAANTFLSTDSKEWKFGVKASKLISEQKAPVCDARKAQSGDNS